MPERKGSGKRKGADVAAIDPKQTKKAKLDKPQSAPKTAGISVSKPTPISVGILPAKTRTPRKKAADMFDVEEEPVAKPASLSAKPKKTEEISVADDDNVDFEAFESEDNAGPNNAAELLAGFETSESESDSDEEGIPLDKLPAPPTPDAQTLVEAKKNKGKNNDVPGVLYIGRIPHGFYEHQMRAYFTQFGTITRLRLARNRRSGAPKHYAFLEFDSTVVADIVQRTMNKYLMFGHILQVRLVPPEQVHERLFKGAESRFKKIPWGKIEGRGLKVGRERDVWQRRIDREQARRTKRNSKLDDFGYDFALPVLKKVDVVKSKSDRQIENGEEVKAITVGEITDGAAVAAEGETGEAVQMKQEGKSNMKKSRKSEGKKAGTVKV